MLITIIKKEAEDIKEEATNEETGLDRLEKKRISAQSSIEDKRLEAQNNISEFEEKHPQLEPLPIINDPQALENARGQIADSRVFLGQIGVNTNRFASVGMQPKTQAKETRLQSFAGNVTVSTS